MNKKFNLLNGLEDQSKLFIDQLFLDSPTWLFDECNIVEYEKGQMIVREHETVGLVYILIKGIVKACDFRVFGISYEFCHYKPVEILGGMEILTETNTYMTTLIADTDCRFIVLKKEKFEQWMKNDHNALWIFSKSTVRYLLNESRIERAYLFMQGIDRVYLFMERRYEQMAQNGKCEIYVTRQQIADETGLSIKTVSRSIKQMMMENLLCVKGRKIILKEEQYLLLKERVRERIDL